MRRVLVFGGIVVGVALGACGSFGSEASPDAGAPPADGGVSDAPSVDAETRRYCERAEAGTKPLYCRDFDDGESILFGWDGTDLGDGGGSLTLDTVERATGAASMRVRLEANTPTCSYARTKRRVVGPTSGKVHVGFDVRIGGVDTRDTDETGFMALSVGDPCTLIFVSSATSGRVTEQTSTDIVHDLARFPTAGTWSHVDVDIDRTSRSLEVMVDGRSAFTNPVVLGAGCLRSTGEIALFTGLYCESTQDAPREVRFDDILVTSTP